MNYTLIDPILSAWAMKNKLMIYKQYKDIEVRSVSVVTPRGETFQIWIDSPLKDKILVHAWDYKKRRKDWSVSILNLARCLEEAILTVKVWAAS